jgi:hypothetical protein
MLFAQVALFEADADLRQVAEEPLAWELVDGFLAFGQRATPETMTTWGRCNAAVRRDLLVAAGGFEESIRCAEDVDLFFRLADRGPVVMIRQPQMLGYRTAGADSLSGNMERLIEGVNFVTEGLRTGRYPDPDGLSLLHERRRLLLARIAFAEGRTRDAYRLVLASPLFLARTWGAGTWLRTLLTPLLSVVRPSRYHFGRERPRNG